MAPSCLCQSLQSPRRGLPLRRDLFSDVLITGWLSGENEYRRCRASSGRRSGPGGRGAPGFGCLSAGTAQSEEVTEGIKKAKHRPFSRRRRPSLELVRASWGVNINGFMFKPNTPNYSKPPECMEPWGWSRIAAYLGPGCRGFDDNLHLSDTVVFRAPVFIMRWCSRKGGCSSAELSMSVGTTEK